MAKLIEERIGYIIDPETGEGRQPRFPSGKLVATPGALNTFEPWEITEAVVRHLLLKQGALGDEDHRTNYLAVHNGGRIMSAFEYEVGVVDAEGDGPRAECQRVWVITEADRTVTTVLLPSEY